MRTIKMNSEEGSIKHEEKTCASPRCSDVTSTSHAITEKEVSVPAQDAFSKSTVGDADTVDTNTMETDDCLPSTAKQSEELPMVTETSVTGPKSSPRLSDSAESGRHVAEGTITIKGDSPSELNTDKGDNPASSDEDICEEADDSDGQWTDISDEVTDDENDVNNKAESSELRNKLSFSSTPVKHVKRTDSSSSLSDEEKQNFAFISEQLSILNKESSEVNTDVHKPQKKQQKRTPSKSKTYSKRTPKKQAASSSSGKEQRKSGRICRKKVETTPTSTPRKRTVADNLDTGSGDDADTSQDALHIDEQDFDETLDRKAEKKGLTAVNVKTIIHELVKNVDVQQMLRNHMNEQLSNMSDSGNLPYEPKMTRAKVKEVLEKGVPLQTWPLSPVKKTVAPKKPSILEIDFPDDEEDDEYSPDKDAEAHESDDDLESMMSSRASDLGSPLPPTPSTPTIRTPFSVRTPQTGDTETFRSLFAEASGFRTCRPSLIGQQFKTSMDALDDSSTQGSETQSDIIARRTRSKLPLKDTSLTAIEEAFVAPDITPDMYDTECDDSEWQEFLRSLVKSDVDKMTDPVDDDVNDPEFDFLEEAEKLEETAEDFRFDKPFRVSKKELTQLITELDDLFPEPEDEDRTLELEEFTLQESPVVKRRKKATVSNQNKSELEENKLIVTPEERLLIEDQMRKHVQLVTQLFFLCKGNEDFEPMTTTCRQLLRELDIFRCVSMARDLSSYNVCNLPSAMDLVGEDRTWDLTQEHEDAASYSIDETNSNATDSDHESVDAKKKKKASGYPLLPSQVSVLWNSPVFLYPQLLPMQRLLSTKEASQCRLKFSKAEDNLIALAFEQFSHLKNCRSLIQKYLLPAKTTKQVNIRIKSLLSARFPDSPLKYFKMNKKPLTRALVVEAFYPEQIKAPKDQDDSVLPKWAQKQRLREISAAKKEKKKEEKKEAGRKRSNSLSLPVSTEDFSNSQGMEMEEAVSPKKRPRSAPVSPNEDDTNRRHVEDHYRSLLRLPCARTVITPDGVFIPFRVLASGKASTDTLPELQPSTSTMNPIQSLASGLPETPKSLAGSIRIIPSTRPGEPPRIISSLIAVAGRPVQLSFGQSDEESKDDPLPLADLQTDNGNIDPIEDNPVEGEHVSESEDTNVHVQPETGACSDPARDTGPQVIEDSGGLVTNMEHLDTGGSANQTHPDGSGEGGMDCDNTFSDEMHNTPQQLEDVHNNSSQQIDAAHNNTLPVTSVQCETLTVVSESEQGAVSNFDTPSVCDNVVPIQVQTSSVISEKPPQSQKDISLKPGETQGAASRESSIALGALSVESSHNQVAISMESSKTQGESVEDQNPNQTETDEAANQVTGLLENEDFHTSFATPVCAEKECVENSERVVESIEGSSLSTSNDPVGIVQATTSPDHDTIVRSEPTPEDRGHGIKDPQQCENIIDSEVCSDEVPTDNVIETSQSDPVAAASSKSLENPSQMFEITADSTFHETNNEQTKGQVDDTDLGVTLDNDIKINSPTKPSDVPPTCEHVYPSTPPRGNSELLKETKDSKSLTDGSTEGNLTSDGSKKMTSSPQITRTPLEIVAAFCSHYLSPGTSPKPPTHQQTLLERTPPKRQSDTGYRELRPKPPCSLNDEEGKQPVSPLLTKVPSKSPKRVLRGNRNILPKAFVLDTKESPTKRAARSLRKRAQMICQRTSPCKLLPQTELQRIQRLQLCQIPKPTMVTQSRRKQAAPVRKIPMRPSYKRSNSESDDLSETEDSSGKRSEDSSRVRAGTKRKLGESDKRQEESDGGQSELEDAGMSQEDSQNEDEVEDSQSSDQSHLDMLMAASTSLGFGQKKSVSREKVKGKTQKKKEQTLAMLAPDLLEMDPKKDEKDTAFAQAYLDRVRDSLKENLDVYEEFLTLMYNLGKEGQSAVEIYQKLEKIFKDFPDLLEDFAGFLLPEQALMCGCFMKNQETTKARTFLRKLEVNYEKQPNHFQRILKVLSQWYQNPQRSPQDLQNMVKPLFRGMPHLLEEFSLFFPDEKPPESYMNDFECVTPSNSDFEEGASVNSFEEVDFPDDLDTYRTKWCRCDCHQDPNEIKQFMRLKHCFNCCLKVIDGKLYFQPSRNKLYPAKVTVKKPSSPVVSNKSVSVVDIEDEQMADKENVNCLGGRPTVISPSVSHLSPARSKRIKLKISRKKAGQKRFLTLCEIEASPTKQEPVADGETTEGSPPAASGIEDSADVPMASEGDRLSPDTSRRDSDALIVNPPVTLQADILQNEKCDSDIPASSGGSPVMLTSFASISFPTTSTSSTSVCSDGQTSVLPIYSMPQSNIPSVTMSSICTTKPVGQTGGFLKISPTKGPSSPLVTQLSFGPAKTSTTNPGSPLMDTSKVGGAQILGGGATLTIGSTISALSGSSVTVTKEDKNLNAIPPLRAESVPVTSTISTLPIQPTTQNVLSKEQLSFPNLVPADAVCHTDAITLNSGQQQSTQATTSTTTLSFGSTHAADYVPKSIDAGNMEGAGFGMSVLNFLDGSSLQGEASQTCMSDILAKAMKTAEISKSDAEVSMSVDWNSFFANFKPGSRNSSPMKQSSVTDPALVQQVPSLTSLQEHLMKAGIINKPFNLEEDVQNTLTDLGQPVTTPSCVTIQGPLPASSVPVTVTLPLYTGGNVCVTQTLPPGVAQAQHVAAPSSSVTEGTSNICTTLMAPSNRSASVQGHDVLDRNQTHTLPRALTQMDLLSIKVKAQSRTETVTSVEQTYVQANTINPSQFKTGQVSVQASPCSGQLVGTADQEYRDQVYTQTPTARQLVSAQQICEPGVGSGQSIEELPAAVSSPAITEEHMDIEGHMDVEDNMEVEWTKDMDKLCLEMCKKSNPVEDTFARIAEKLKVVTPNEVAARFDKLMQLFASLNESEEDSDY